MEHRDVFILDVIVEYCDQIIATIYNMNEEDILGNI